MLVQGESLIMFWAQYEVLWWVILGLGLVTLVLIRMGVRLFNREELLGRDIDEINFKAGWRTFAAAFNGNGRGHGLRAWYRGAVAPTVGRMGWPIGLMAAALLAAAVLGYRYAAVYKLPLAAADLAGVASNFNRNLAQLGFVSAGGAAWVFFTNLRALVIATALGIFSFGVLGVVLLMVPLGLAGFFAGQVALIGLSPLQFFVAFILPHGMFEITAAVLEGAAILRLGGSVISPPGGKTLSEGWLMALADWAKISLALVLPLLLVAALVEVFITPLVVSAVLR